MPVKPKYRAFSGLRKKAKNQHTKSPGTASDLRVCAEDQNDNTRHNTFPGTYRIYFDGGSDEDL